MAKIKLSSKNLENNKVASEYKHGIYTELVSDNYRESNSVIIEEPDNPELDSNFVLQNGDWFITSDYNIFNVKEN